MGGWVAAVLAVGFLANVAAETVIAIAAGGVIGHALFARARRRT
ncbi:MAG: hypothetical protein ACT4PI_14305 [Actinomycetota bacterium]